MNRGMMRLSGPVLPNIQRGTLRLRAPADPSATLPQAQKDPTAQTPAYAMVAQSSLTGLPVTTVTPYGTVAIFALQGSGLGCGILQGSQANQSAAGLGGIKQVDFAVNGYNTPDGTWHRFDTTMWYSLNQIAAYDAANSPTGSATVQFQIYNAAPQADPIADFVLHFVTDGASGNTGLGNAACAANFPQAAMHAAKQDATTNTILVAGILGHDTTGTPTAGFGAGLQFQLQSTTTPDRNAAEIDAVWVSATDATRTGRITIGAWDATAMREAVRTEANGTVALLGFYGATAVVQPASTGNVHTVAAGATTNVFTNTTFDGSTGSTAYTVGDIVKALKSLGLLAA